MILAIILVLLVIGSVLFHFLSPWYLTPLASNWSTIDDTLNVTFWITGFVFVVVNLFMAWCVVRYRHRKGTRAHYEPENKKLEWWLIGVTSVGVAAMLTPGLFVWAQFVNVPEDADVFEVVGQQWQWSYRFPGKDGLLGTVDASHISFDNPFGMNPDDPNGQDDVLVSSSEVHLPINRPVKALLRSKDVLHDFAVAQFRVKMDLVPGLITYLWFTPTKAGKYDVLCEELCGVGHYKMRGHVVIEEENDFRAWLKTHPTYAQTLAGDTADIGDSLAERGRQLAQDRGCFACHSVDGSSGVGPTWQGLFGKTETLADGNTVVVDEAYLRESINDPNARMVEGYAPIMPPGNFTDEELDALIEFIKPADQTSSSPDTGNDLIAMGKRLSQERGCFACHSVDGGPGVGPTWLGLFGKTEVLADGTTVLVDADYLRESINDPNARVVKGYAPMMPPGNFTDEELDALIAYTRDGLGGGSE
jgi:cytochrome c oxidase subunit 2